MGRRTLYPNTPTELRKDKRAWFHETNRGLTIVAQIWREKTGYVGATITEIPWKKLRVVVDRHRRIERRRKAARS